MFLNINSRNLSFIVECNARLLQLYKIFTSNFCDHLVRRIILYSQVVHLPYRGIKKRVPGKGNLNRAVETDDQTIVVHHYMALGHIGDPLCYLALGVDAGMAGTALDAY